MKKKLMTGALLLAFGAVAVTGGTLAYFTDTEAQKNVMTTGKVDIKQLEEKRVWDANGEYDGMADFENDVALMPMVDNRTADEKADEATAVVDGYFNPKMKNVVDKIVSVVNVNEKSENAQITENRSAYVRTILAFETQRHYTPGSSTEFADMHDVYIGVNGDFDYLNRYVEVDGVEYVVAVKVYENALAPEERSTPSLKQIFLAPTANNEVADIFGDEYTILAVSQGTQTAGFEFASEALDTAFGNLNNPEHANYVTDETLIEWLSAAK